jgi:diguanylate cyclase (GGDEF)-like protein
MMSAKAIAGSDQDRIRQLEETLQLREYEIQLLKETAEAVTSQLHLERLLQLVADRARDLIQAETVLIPVLNRDCTEYTYRAGSGRNLDEILGESLPLDFGVCGWVWRHRKPWWSGVLAELDEEERNRWEEEAGTVIMVPLIGKQHFLGGIAGLTKIGAANFDRRDLDLLSMFASQVSIAMENATTFEELEAAKQRAESFQEELRALNQELVAINKDLEHMALYDSLTGLPNRYLIQDRLQQGLYAARREARPLAILMVDLDRFKDINDTLGHHVGDELLKQVGIRFQRQLRQADTIGRLGGDEFAVIIPGANAEGARQVAAHLEAALESPLELEHGSCSVFASIGVALYPEHGEDVPTLLRQADVAMYLAKANRSGVFVYDPSQDEHTPDRLSLATDLRQALDQDQFTLHYQPKLDLSRGRVVGVEALMRWHHPVHGLVPPDVFIPYLEQSGLLKRYTHWALDNAFALCHRWNRKGWDLSVAVNLSMYNLRDPELQAKVGELLRRYALRPNALVLEVTESGVMSDPHHVSQLLHELAAQGVQFSIDDFGTGYSSLSHLKRLSVAELKIDKAFVMDMERDADDATIVRSTVELAHTMGLRVVAEGVETEGCLAMLRGMGCDLVQGFYLSAPMSASELEAWLREGPWPVSRLS